MSAKTKKAAKERQQAVTGGVVITSRPAKKPVPKKKTK
jgi:hypothetical protein